MELVIDLIDGQALGYPVLHHCFGCGSIQSAQFHYRTGKALAQAFIAQGALKCFLTFLHVGKPQKMQFWRGEQGRIGRQHGP